MIECHQTYDLVPGYDQQAYGAWAKKAIGFTLQQPGLVEFRAYRNPSGDPQVLVVTVWESFADWANIFDNGYPALESESHPFVTNRHYVIWDTSPLVPQPLRPAK